MEDIDRYLQYLPSRLRLEARELSVGRAVEELRLRRGFPLSLTVGGKNVVGKSRMTDKEAQDALFLLCGGSLHAHMQTLTQGYICLSCGGRAGVVGRATVREGRVEAVREITSIVIRIPRRIDVGGEQILSYMKNTNYAKGILIYSLPGVGKTTLLRTLAHALSQNPHLKRVALIDTRLELGMGMEGDTGLIDILREYPKAEGISIAVRCLSPQILVCDEIGGLKEAEAILASHPTGIPLIASAHGRGREDVCAMPGIASLIRHRVFSCLFRLERNADKLSIFKEEV